MTGKQEVIQYLNQLIGGELAARDQYFIHGRMLEEWGYSKLFAAYHHEMEHETEHATAMIKRVLFLGGQPNMQVHELDIGSNVQEMLEKDLALEYRVQAALKKGIHLCEQAQDYVTQDILLAQLKDTEEDHAHWLEKQLNLIRTLGLAVYLQYQI